MRVSEADTRATRLAMAAAMLVLGHHVAARSLREGLFLATFPVAELPKAMLGAALFAVPMALVVAHWMARFGPGRLTPILFLMSACASVSEWWLLPSLPRAIAIALYLHVSIGGALLVSAFWSIINERFDPHSLKAVVGRIGGFCTLGGLAGGLMMERAAHSLSARTSLLLIGVLGLGAAVLTQRLGRTLPPAKPIHEGPKARERLTGYLRTLALLVACTAAVSAFGDFALKQAAAARFTHLESLVRFFAVFYTAAALVGFLMQVLVSRRLLDAIGVGRTLSVPPLFSIALGAVSLLAPSLVTIGAMRGSDLALGPSLYRTAFEPLFTPVAAASKRRSKALIDVVFDKGGETFASLLILALLGAAGPALVQRAPAALVILASALAVLLSLRAQRGYVIELEASLRAGTSNESLPDVDDARRLLLSGTTLGIDREKMMKQIAHLRKGRVAPPEPEQPAPRPPRENVEQILSSLRVLLTGEPKAVRDLLSGASLDPRLAAFVIPYLGHDALAKPAVEALRGMGLAALGVLTEAMHSTSLPAVVRRRIPHVLRSARGDRVVRALLGALSCDAVDVRYRAALALAEVTGDDRRGVPEHSEVYALVLNEIARGPLDRTSIDHVFALLALVLNQGTLELARQGVLSEDRKLRGTALEYLESLLPETVRTPLVAALAEHAGPRDAAEKQPNADLLAELRRSFRADLPGPSLGSEPD
jgi:ATP:ADP antiporter, AAA family